RLDPRRIRLLPEEVRWRQAVRSLGGAVLDHLLAHYPRDPPPRPAAAARARSVRPPSLVLRRALRAAASSRRLHRGAGLEHVRALPEPRPSAGADRADRRRAPPPGANRLQDAARTDGAKAYRR